MSEHDGERVTDDAMHDESPGIPGAPPGVAGGRDGAVGPDTGEHTGPGGIQGANEVPNEARRPSRPPE